MSPANKNDTNRRRRWLYAGAGAVVVVLLILALRPRPVPADFAQVVRGPLRVTLDEEGETRVRDRFVISAPVAGRVLRIELEPGDAVTADTVVATFQPGDPTFLDARSRAQAEARVGAAEAALGRARAERQRADAELRYAESERERYRKLAEQQIVAQDRLDAAELAASTKDESLAAARFAVLSAEKDLAAARAVLVGVGQTREQDHLDPLALRSPIDGVVLRRLRESEAVVPAGEALLEIADPAQLEIVSDFLSTDAVRIEAGDRVLIDQWGGDHDLDGRVKRVEPSGFTKISALGVEEQRVNVVIDFVRPREAWKALGDGYRVEVRVVVWESEDVLRVPTSSLFRKDDDWAVFSVVDGEAVLRKVELGHRNALEAEVMRGLDEGDVVVVHPSDAIVPGVAVEARTA